MRKRTGRVTDSSLDFAKIQKPVHVAFLCDTGGMSGKSKETFEQVVGENDLDDKFMTSTIRLDDLESPSPLTLRKIRKLDFIVPVHLGMVDEVKRRLELVKSLDKPEVLEVGSWSAVYDEPDQVKSVNLLRKMRARLFPERRRDDENKDR